MKGKQTSEHSLICAARIMVLQDVASGIPQ